MNNMISMNNISMNNMNILILYIVNYFVTIPRSLTHAQWESFMLEHPSVTQFSHNCEVKGESRHDGHSGKTSIPP